MDVTLLPLLVVFVVGYVAGRITGWLAGPAAVVALLLFLFGLAVPAPVAGVVESVVAGFYDGNELLFLSGLLFGVAGGRTRGRPVGRREG